MDRTSSVDFLFPAAVGRTEKLVLLGAAALFLAVVSAALATDRLWLLGAPVGLAFLYLLAENQKAAFVAIMALVPFSIQMGMGGTAALQFPTEPMLLLFLGVWLLRTLLAPVSSAPAARLVSRLDTIVLLFIASLALSVVTTTIPLLSVKLFLNTCWYLGAFYFYPRRNIMDTEDMLRVLRWLFVGTTGVAAVVILQHSQYGFASYTVNLSAEPFFEEHGSYAAHLAIVLGLALGVAFGAGGKTHLRRLAVLTALVTTVGILLSLTRAAWVGVGLLLLFLFVTKAREFLRFRTFVLVTIVAIGLSAAIGFLGVRATLEKHMTTISDIQTNISNLERFNRWMAAIRMIEKHPLFGVGYGTYPVHYYTYRDRRFETPDSGFYGFPHNDYLQFFAEAGIPGFVSFLLLLGTLYAMGIKAFFRLRDPMRRHLLLGCLGGMLTYLVHAFFNGFLYIDKIAAPFWMSMAFAATLIADSKRQPVPAALRGGDDRP